MPLGSGREDTSLHPRTVSHRPDRPLFSHLLQQQSFAFNRSSFPFYYYSYFLAVAGLPCCVWAVSSRNERELLCSCGARVSWGGGLSCRRAQAVGAWASVVVTGGFSLSAACGDLPRLVIAPVSPTLQGEFRTTGPPGKPQYSFLSVTFSSTGFHA